MVRQGIKHERHRRGSGKRRQINQYGNQGKAGTINTWGPRCDSEDLTDTAQYLVSMVKNVKQLWIPIRVGNVLTNIFSTNRPISASSSPLLGLLPKPDIFSHDTHTYPLN
jgi:hypothetical protein